MVLSIVKVNCRQIIESFKGVASKGTPSNNILLIKQILLEIRQMDDSTALCKQDILDIIHILTPEYLDSEKKSIFANYIVKYISYFSKQVFSKPTQPKDDMSPTQGNEEPILSIDPDECKDMEYNQEFLSAAGWVNPDGKY